MARKISPEEPYLIQVSNRQKCFLVHPQAVTRFCAALLHDLKQPAQAVSVAFISARRMRIINRCYLARDYATDVLSFSYEGVLVEGLPFLGEVIISPEIALRQAVRCRVNPERELRKILIHGLLHLLGYDHESDQGLMSRVQANLLRRKFFAQPPALADLKERQ